MWLMNWVQGSGFECGQRPPAARLKRSCQQLGAQVQPESFRWVGAHARCAQVKGTFWPKRIMGAVRTSKGADCTAKDRKTISPESNITQPCQARAHPPTTAVVAAEAADTRAVVAVAAVVATQTMRVRRLSTRSTQRTIPPRSRQAPPWQAVARAAWMRAPRLTTRSMRHSTPPPRALASSRASATLAWNKPNMPPFGRDTLVGVTIQSRQLVC
jgi:hypothetical protein